MPSIEVILEDVPSSTSEEQAEDGEEEVQVEEEVDSIACAPSQENAKEIGDDLLQSKAKVPTSLKHRKKAKSKKGKKRRPSSCLANLEKELMKQAELVEQAIGLHLDQTDLGQTSPSKQLAELEQELLLRRKLVEQALSAVSNGRRNVPEIVFSVSSGRSRDSDSDDEKKEDGGMREVSKNNDAPRKTEEVPASKSSFEKESRVDSSIMESPVIKSLVEKELDQEMSPAVVSIESTSPSSPEEAVVNPKRNIDTMNDSPAVVSLGCSATEEELDLRLSLDEAFDRVGSVSEKSKPQEAPLEHPPSVAKSFTTGVYINDDVFGWLPGTVLETHDEFAFVSIDMPSNWSESTAVHGDDTDRTFGTHKTVRLEKDTMDRIVNEHMVPQHSIRRVMWKDYKDGILPSQNDQVAKPDMGDLEHLHEAAILFNLKERHFMSKPYTRVGDIIVAMNPFNWIDDLYTTQTQEKYTREIIWQGKETRPIKTRFINVSRSNKMHSLRYESRRNSAVQVHRGVQDLLWQTGSQTSCVRSFFSCLPRPSY
jgi:hypothetical protein